MQEIAKYILSQLPKLDDFELDQISSLATTIRVSRKVRKHYTDNPLLKYDEHAIDAQDYALKQSSLEGDWVVRDKEPL